MATEDFKRAYSAFVNREKRGLPATREHRRPWKTSHPSDQTKSLTGKEQDHPDEVPEALFPKILAPPQLPRPKGYAHGMAAAGQLVVTAGHGRLE